MLTYKPEWLLRAAATMLISVLSICAMAQAKPFDTKGFAWEQPIEIQTATGFVSVQLTTGVLDKALPTLNDLRVLDAEHQLVPHLIHWIPRDAQPEEVHRPVQILNRTYQAGQYARIVLDFGDLIEKNRIEVELSGNNFRRKAQLEGSSDSQTWETVSEDQWLFDVQQGGKEFHARTLNFPTNNFRYLRLTVFHMPDDPERIEITNVTSAMKATPPPGDTTELVLTPGPRQWNGRDKISLWDFDLGSRNLPLESLEFEFLDSYFYRGYELHARNSTTETVEMRTEAGRERVERETPWRQMKSGLLHRTVEASTTTQDLKLEKLGVVPRHLQLRVYDADNPALNLNQAVATALFPSLIFEARPGVKYRLLYGRDNTSPANYDLGRAVRDLDPANLPAARLGVANPLAHAEDQTPWTERNAFWLMLLLACCAVAMGFVMVRSLKGLPPASGPSDD